ncbi:pyridoxal phosphate-dependent decarboxylase family protein [Spirillospora sp. NPDC048911]|uniref:pyridoxal phosphate-dependent decarboxylase family protein n=1 Tax=Spirillospora sp. NPDC048911 TaxID=3364527 RepID=UPI00371A0905
MADDRAATATLHRGLALEAFDSHLFRRNSATVTAKLEEYLDGTSIRGLRLTDPALLGRAARALMTRERQSIPALDEQKLSAIVDLYLRTGIQLHSPGYMGRQFSGVVPLAGVIELMTSVAGQPASFYEAGQLPNVVERIMADELNEFIGWDPERFSMVTTSGGSLANLTALLAARNRAFPRFWSDGAAAAGRRVRPAIAMGDNAHYSLSRAAGVMGIGEEQIVRLPVNRHGTICMERARPVLASAERRHLKVFCLVASAGTTSLGAFDPLEELADLAREKNLWLHVDGAHGASLLVSDRLRHKLKGIHRADSLCWDAHKMMFVPMPCTMLFYRNKEHGYGAFRQEASYVFEQEPDIYTALDSAEQNFECSKRPMIMSLWALWALYGPALFAEKIEYLCRLTQEIYHEVCAAPDFEALHRPEANILCFRYRPDSRLADAELHRLQLAIRNHIKAEGRFFISKVNVDGVAALRVVMMNHQITREHFQMLLDDVRNAGRTLLGNDQRRDKEKE